MVERIFGGSPGRIALNVQWLEEFFYWMKSINVRI
jgi:hypothetical protein